MVERIKSVDNETKLLVVDKATEEVYKRFSVVVRGTLPTVHTMTSEQQRDNDDVIDFKEQQAAPPPLPETPPPDEEEQQVHHSTPRRPDADSHSIETPSNDQVKKLAYVVLPLLLSFVG